MHPNHKIKNTRLKLIKILTTNPNCETILKCALSLPDSQLSTISSNSKLSYYFNSLFGYGISNKNDPQIVSNQTMSLASKNTFQLSNNDKEVLLEFNQILTRAGLNYKTEYYAVINAYTRNSSLISGYEPSSSPDLASFATESTYLIVNTDSNWLRAIVDLTTQFDKEFDDEILKIFHKSKQIFNLFLEQYDKIIQELSNFSYNLTNKVVLMHSSVRKQLFQRLKSKLIKQYDIKKNWMGIIENMTHEKCIWFDAHCWPYFYILDQTESPCRERRRLKKSHLYLAEKYFKEETRSKLLNEKQTHPLKYLLNNYDDYFNSGSNNSDNISTRNSENDSEKSSGSTFEMSGMEASSYMLNQWKYSENIK